MDATGTFLIVVGVDGSEQSLAALHWAVDEARLRHGTVRLITAWPTSRAINGRQRQ